MRRKFPMLLAVAVLPILLLDGRSLAESEALRAAPLQLDVEVEEVTPEPPATDPTYWGDLPPPEIEHDIVEEPPERFAAKGDDDPIIASIARETWVFAEPSWGSRRLGYLRAGAIVEREEEVTSHQGCKRGWYRIQPKGFVCVGAGATTDRLHPVVRLSDKAPNMHGLPYTYVMSRYPTPPLYARLPSLKQQHKFEPSRESLLRKHERLKRAPEYIDFPEPDPMPDVVASGELIPSVSGSRRGRHRVLLRHARVRSGFGLIATYEHDDRHFGLTNELYMVPLDRTRVVDPSKLTGIKLSDELTLPIAIVRSRYAKRYEQVGEDGPLSIVGRVPQRAFVPLTGKSIRKAGHLYLQAKNEGFVRADQVTRVDRFNKAPAWARRGKKWIDVSILQQRLVAYEGLKPVFVTLVSTGGDGIADHKESHATIQGTFLVHTKHVSVQMDGDDRGDEFDLRDVPFVQYFTEGYALHGAYWHDDFGIPRSHGCVNLAPNDAAWLFGWTDPKVPDSWHAALSLKNGTTVYVHP